MPLLGAGVLGNRTLPAWLVTMLLLILLVLLTYKMFLKAFKLHAYEQRHHKGRVADSEQRQEVLPESVRAIEEDQHCSELSDLSSQSAPRSRMRESEGVPSISSITALDEADEIGTQAIQPAYVQASIPSNQQQDVQLEGTRGK